MATQEAASVALSNSVLEVGDHGSSTLATILPLLISPALARYAAGVESVIKSQSRLATELERLNAETLRLDAAILVPAQIDAAEKLKRCRKMIESVSKFTKNIKSRIGAINGYKTIIIQHMPELKNIGSSEAAASSDNTTVAQQVTPEAAVDAADTFEVDAAPSASTAVGDLASLSPNSAEALVTGVATSDSTAACALPADKSTFNVILKAKGASPYQVIKEIRAITGLGLKEAQALVDNLPNVIKEGASWDEAKDIETHLKAAGGDVDVE